MARPSEEIWREVDFVNRTLLDLHQQSFKAFEAQEGLWNQAWISVVQSTIPMQLPRVLERYLPSEQRPKGNLVDSRNLVFLDFDEKEQALPVLDVAWNLGNDSIDEFRLRFFLLHGGSNPRDLQVTGFRLDSPEGAGDTERNSQGQHNYWHCQMIVEFEKDDRLIHKLRGGQDPPWTPIRQPAFPLPIRAGPECLGDSLTVLLLSIYGLKQLRRRFFDPKTVGELTKRIEAMGILTIKPRS